KMVTIYGGVSAYTQTRALRDDPEIVFGCPGRVLDLLQQKVLRLDQVETLVLDEADHMFDMGFLPDIRRIIAKLPEKRQNLFFSATMPSYIRTLADQVLKDPITVQVDARAPAETVSHALYPVTDSLRRPLLQKMLKSHASGRVLIFTRTKHRARSLATVLEKQGHRVSALQGNMPQNKRQRAIDGFRNGRYDILVATDIAARGIDITDVTHVINYDMPSTVDAYTHRIGRTGRALRSGTAYTLATQADEPLVHRVEKVLHAAIERRTLEGFDYGSFSPQNQGYRSTEKKAALSRSDHRGGMTAPPQRRGTQRRRRISKRG
ncbi:DEAD/DEAH box helicase, partial [bacterium]|nr:DEAD/DEAH box helicase [bacterium]